MGCVQPTPSSPPDEPVAPPGTLVAQALPPVDDAGVPYPLCPEVRSQSAHCLLVNTAEVVAVGVDDGASCLVSTLSAPHVAFLAPTALHDGFLLSCEGGERLVTIDVATGERMTEPLPGCQYLTDSADRLLLLREGETPFLPVEFTLFDDLESLRGATPSGAAERVWTLDERPWALAADANQGHVVGQWQASLPFSLNDASRLPDITLQGSWPPRGLEVLGDGSLLVLTTENILQHRPDGTLWRIIPIPRPAPDASEEYDDGGVFSSGFACWER